MLSFEPGIMQHYGLTRARLRLLTIGWLQSRALRRAAGAIFLTRYAASVIQKATGRLRRVAIVPHGVGDDVRHKTAGEAGPSVPREEIRCLYVSNTTMYKHQWVVVRAIAELRRRGRNIRLLLVGGGSGPAQRLLDTAIAEVDPRGEFVECVEFVPRSRIPQLLAKADIFVFASSCENMPVTLLEAMASGLPVACSNRGPMPEVLQDGGMYFDPEDATSIAHAVERIITDPCLERRIAARARELSDQYTWARCSSETLRFIRASHDAQSRTG